MPRPKGTPKTGGRAKGTPNKVSLTIKEQLLEALGEVGGVEYLKKIAREDPRTFCGLIGRILPTQSDGNAEQSLSRSPSPVRNYCKGNWREASGAP